MGLADFPLRRREWYPCAQRFNPCFDGWGSPTGPRGGRGALRPRVSILVLMDGARRRR